jgi:hypothetical protein
MTEKEIKNIDFLIEQINNRKDSLSNAGTRPLVSDIVQRAQDLVGVITKTNSNNSGHIVLVIPCGADLLSFYFKGWKVEDFERLAIELENLKT